jgi:DNA-binding Lrp family transcriptional regulator
MSDITLDDMDYEILRMLQENAKVSAKEISSRIGSPITTIYSRINKMEDAGIIKGYKPILDSEKLGKTATAFILASFSYRTPGIERPLNQRSVAEEIAEFPEVQEIHIITGDWDFIIKLKAMNVAKVGEFVVDKLRTVRGISKTLTCMVFNTLKESMELDI